MPKRNIYIILTLFILSCSQADDDSETNLNSQKHVIITQDTLSTEKDTLGIQKPVMLDFDNNLEVDMDYDTFLDKLNNIVLGDGHIVASEEEYFRRLLFQVESHSAEKVTPNLLLQVFERSITSSESIEFNEEWNGLDEPELFPDFDDMSTQENLEFTKNTIRFFVSDLRRLGDEVLNDPYKGYGVTSPSGCRWYNYGIYSIVEGWSRFYNDGVEKDNDNKTKYTYSWSDISDILLFGKSYE